MTEAKRPLKVFLCHAHSDKDTVKALYTRLTNDGVDAWLDKEKLLPGQDWELEIRKAVREADVVVVCLSKQFNQAGFRQKEVRLALDTAMEQPEGEIFIIPARLEECDTLESLRKWHWVDLFEDNGYEMLMRALQARADRIGATLQTKKSWLPIGNTQPVIIKKPSPPIEKPTEKKQVKPKPKKETQKPVTFKKTMISIAGFIVLVLVAIFGLSSLTGKPEPIPVLTNTASLKTFTSIPLSKTSTITNTPTLTLIPVQIIIGYWFFESDANCDGSVEYLTVLEIKEDGTFTFATSDEPPGEWIIDGDSVYLDRYGGMHTVDYSGKIVGENMSGEAKGQNETVFCWTADKR